MPFAERFASYSCELPRIEPRHCSNGVPNVLGRGGELCGLPANTLELSLVLGANPCRAGSRQKVRSPDLDPNMSLESAGWHVDGCVARRPLQLMRPWIHYCLRKPRLGKIQLVYEARLA